MRGRRSLLTLLALLAAVPSGAAAQAGVPASVPALRGEVVTADGGSAAGLVVRVHGAAQADSAVVDSAGRFTLALPAAARSGAVQVSIDAGSGGARRYLPTLARVPRAALADAQRFVMVPARWTIREGSFAGTEVAISLDRAFTGTCRGCQGFYRSEPPARGATGIATPSGWPEAAFPLRVAFDHEYTAAPIGARDSAAFWRVAAEVEAAFGADLFRPARHTDTAPDDRNGPVDVVLVRTDNAMPLAGLTTIFRERGEITYGAIRLRRPPGAIGATGAIVAHELVHALGFGHTCQWRSVLADLNRCPLMHADEVTAEDVAYAQLFRRVRALQRGHHASWGMDAALAGERVIVLGRAPDDPADEPEPRLATP